MVKAKNYVPSSKELEYGEAVLLLYKKHLGEPVDEVHHGLEIRILGPGCINCEKLMADTMQVLEEIGVAADVEHVHDLNEIAGYGLVATPALVINGNVILSGRVPNIVKLRKILEEEIGGKNN
jgi:small redox-active disulfide protein 2